MDYSSIFCAWITCNGGGKAIGTGNGSFSSIMLFIWTDVTGPPFLNAENRNVHRWKNQLWNNHRNEDLNFADAIMNGNGKNYIVSYLKSLLLSAVHWQLFRLKVVDDGDSESIYKGTGIREYAFDNWIDAWSETKYVGCLYIKTARMPAIWHYQRNESAFTGKLNTLKPENRQTTGGSGGWLRLICIDIVADRCLFHLHATILNISSPFGMKTSRNLLS